MIVKEILSQQFIKQYSDRGMKLRQKETGVLYDEAIDLIPCEYTYEETDEKMEMAEEQL